MLKCSKTLKIALLLAGIYAAFMAGLFIEISSAKYQETRLAYTNFGAASFNAVILNNTGTGYRAFSVFDAPVQLSQVSGYRPGMIYQGGSSKNPAQEIPFTVANGVDGTNASDASVEYQICLRTTGNLPLKYSLRFGETIYQAVYKEQITEGGNVWYERRFYETVDGQPKEAMFELTGGRFASKDYTLIVEWPVQMGADGKATNDVQYMKELDLLELFVIVSSKNMENAPVQTIEVQNGTGILILDPAKGAKFIHTVDYRAFTTDSETHTTFYNFVIENGVGKKVAHTKMNTTYTMDIEVPYTVSTGAPYTMDTKDFRYSLKDAEGQTVSMVDGGYRLYDVLYGKGTVKQEYEPGATFTAADLKAWSASDSQYKLYKVYSVTSNRPLQNTDHDACQYQLVLTGTGTDNISGEVAFANKIDIIVTATESGSAIPVAQSVEGGDADA